MIIIFMKIKNLITSFYQHNSLFSWNKIRKAVKEYSRVLKKGGIAIIETPLKIMIQSKYHKK